MMELWESLFVVAYYLFIYVLLLLFAQIWRRWWWNPQSTHSFILDENEDVGLWFSEGWIKGTKVQIIYRYIHHLNNVTKSESVLKVGNSCPWWSVPKCVPLRLAGHSKGLMRITLIAFIAQSVSPVRQSGSVHRMMMRSSWKRRPKVIAFISLFSLLLLLLMIDAWLAHHSLRYPADRIKLPAWSSMSV